MPASRPILLPFLYPMLYTPGQVTRAASTHLRQPGIASPSLRSATRSFSSAAGPRRQQARPRRYGTANEPLPYLDPNNRATSGGDVTRQPENLAAQAEQGQDAEEATNNTPEDAPGPSEPSNGASTGAPESRSEAPRVNVGLGAPELETVLQMPSPSEVAKNGPHLKTPPYVHHFDTYSLVKRLAEGGFKEDQAVTVMKAVRGLLSENMQLARNGLVSKSNVENETYLFRAACSELKTEIQNNRKADIEKMRTERLQLQHEVEILGQRLTQESQALKDDLKGLFDDRRMAVRIEQKDMEGKIQELNYKISVVLNSDSRGDVEGLRWIVARRAAIAVAISAFMILGTLKYASYTAHMQELEKKKLAEREQENKNGGHNGNGNGNGNGGNGQGLAERIEEGGTGGLLVAETGERGFVSLG